MKKSLFIRILFVFWVLALSVNLIGCDGSGDGTKYIVQTSTSGDEKIVGNNYSVEPTNKFELADSSDFKVSIPSESFSYRYSIEVTKNDLHGKDDAERAVEGKTHGLPEGYLPTSSFYNIRIKVTEMPVARASIAMDTYVWLNKEASILLASIENLDWEANDYYIAVLDGNNSKETWYFVPTSKFDVTGSNAFQMESNSLGKSYCIAKKVKSKPTPVDPTPEPKVVVNSVALSAEQTSIDTDETKKFTKDISVSLKVSYTGNIDSKSIESQIKLYAFSNFEFSSEVKSKNEGGLYYYTSELTNPSSGASEITYVFTIPAKAQEYDKAKHPANLFIEASFSLEGIEYRSKQPLSIALLPPFVEPEPVTSYVFEPFNNSKVWIDQKIQVVFTHPMNKESVETALKLIDSDNNLLSKELYSISWEDNDHRMVLTPNEGCFDRLSKYSFKISNGEAGAKSLDGGSLNEEVSIAFETTVLKGEGIAAKPYEVACVEDLEYIRDNFVGNEFSGVYFKQTCDVDLSKYSTDEGWEPIGNDTKEFTASYDGNGQKVTNLFIDRPGKNYVGLFGKASGKISNLGVEIADAGVTGYHFVGGLVGRSDGDISNCYSAGNVTGDGDSIGGLVGELSGAMITNCYATGNVTGGRDNTGGLVGLGNGNISNCYATGSVIGKNYAGGGLVGLAYSDVSNVVALNPSISASSDCGRVAGDYDCSFSNCYANAEMTDSTTTIPEGTSDDKNGKNVSLADCKGPDFWTSGENWADGQPWDSNIWNFPADGFPTLKGMAE